MAGNACHGFMSWRDSPCWREQNVLPLTTLEMPCQAFPNRGSGSAEQSTPVRIPLPQTRKKPVKRPTSFRGWE